MFLNSVWLQRFKAETPFVKGKNTYVDLVCAIPEIQENKNSKSALVVGQAENTKYNSKGYVQKENSNGIYEILKKAEEEQKYVLMRFERQRKDTADQEMDIEDLYLSFGPDRKIDAGREFTYRVLTGIYDFNKMDWILTNPQSDPKQDPPEVEEWIKNNVIGNQVTPDEFFETRQDTSSNENYESLMPKSNEFSKRQHLITFYYFLDKIVKDENLKLTDDDVRNLSRVLLNLSNRVQFMLVDTQEPNYSDYSHSVARQIIFNSVEIRHKITDKLVNKADINEWANAILKDASNLTNWVKEQ